jgi:hypothetical protein
VEHGPGGVDHRPERCRQRGQTAKDVVDDLLGRERATANTLLRCADRITHARPTQATLRLGKSRVGEQRVSLRDGAAWIRLHRR